jgi:hypothetical protein
VYESYLGWLDQPQVLTISFEDLIQNRAATLTRMLDHLEKSGVALEADRAQALARLDRAMTPKRSPTFRAGQPGNWRQYFTEANRRTFQDVAGDLLVRLGYEQGVDW